jgi:Holliday junction resolvase RusA-like endonuclease
MSQIFFFTITHKFPSLNDVIGLAKKHWAQYYRLKKAETSLVAEYVRSLAAAGDFPCDTMDQVSIDFLFFEKAGGRVRDWDNVTFAKKFILDGLVEAGAIHDDSPRHILNITERVRYSDEYAVKIAITV